MNYIDLINNFWQLDEGWQFSSNETRLYFYLVKTANFLQWENNFWHSDGKTTANAGMSINTLKTSRNKLQQAGLIGFTVGGKGYGDKTRYQILTPNPLPKLQPKSHPNVTPNPLPLSKLNKTKLNTLPSLEALIETQLPNIFKNGGVGDSPELLPYNPIPPLGGSNLFRQPKIPELREVIEYFVGQEKDDVLANQMANEFFNKHNAVGWFMNGSPIIKWSALANNFISNWRKNHSEDVAKPYQGASKMEY